MNLRQEVLNIAQRIALKNKREIDMRTLDFFSHINEIVIRETESILQEERYSILEEDEREELKFNVIFNTFMNLLGDANLNILQWHHRFVTEMHEDLSEYDTVFEITLTECVNMFANSLKQKLQENVEMERQMVESLGLS